MEGVFCIPFFVGTEADNNSPIEVARETGFEVVKVHCGTVLEDAFSTWRQIRPPKTVPQFRAEKRSAQASAHPLSQAQGGNFLCVD